MSAIDELKAIIEAAKDTLDAIVTTAETGDDAALRFVCQRQLPLDMHRLADGVGRVVAERAA